MSLSLLFNNGMPCRWQSRKQRHTQGGFKALILHKPPHAMLQFH